MSISRLFFLVWAAWGATWMAAAWWSNRTERSPGLGREIGYRVVMAIGVVLVAYPAHRYEGMLRLWRLSRPEAFACLALTVAGFAFVWWARIHLGRLWSGRVTKKEGHRVVDTGPYGVVRHPIYTGLLFSVLATILAKGTVLGLAGAAILTLGVWMKARLEERWLSAELGPDEYAAYRRRVPMLVPFGPRGE
jgi:protein-S-isoprenylcysteine O-methyltransferase Ste14